MGAFRREFGSRIFFFVASDDIKWAKKHLKGDDVVFSPQLKFEDDFAVLTNCDHIILSGGTFGWWAAWLSTKQGRVVYFDKYPRPNSKLSHKLDLKRYYNPFWVAINK
jgi:galactoside 2-L-fucosyltransferase 1/2